MNFLVMKAGVFFFIARPAGFPAWRGRRSVNFRGLLAGLLLVVAGAREAVAGPEPSWTNLDGVTIRARFVGWDRTHVILFRNGRDYRVPADRLAPDSLDQARRLLKGDDESTLPREGVTGAASIPPRSKVLAPAAKPPPESGAIPHSLFLSPVPPTPQLVKDGRLKPRDKHGMPLYSRERVRHVRTTAYTCSEADHLAYGSMNAAGTRLRFSGSVCSAAADWSVYPVGTTFKIKGMSQLFVVDDYGSALVGTGTIDLYLPDRTSMNAWGRRNVEITIVKWGSSAGSAELLRPRIHHEHCRRMYLGLVGRASTGASRASR
jgi:3D (Asp-Asp-Asp) domain-containing protein